MAFSFSNLQNSGIMPSLTNSLKNCWYLIQYSFTLTAKNSNIMKPSINSLIYSLVMACIVIICLYCLLIAKVPSPGRPIVGILLVVFILFPYKFFYDIRQQAKEILYIFGALQAKEYSSDEVNQEISEVKWKLRLFAVGNLVASFRNSEDKSNNSATSDIVATAMGDSLELGEEFLLPAIVIDKLSMLDALKKIAGLKNHIPEALTGVVGINFFGGVLTSIVFFVFVLLLLIGFALGYFLPHLFPATDLFVTQKFTLNYFPLFWTAALGLLVGCIITPVKQFLKCLYFTILYALIEKPGLIPPQEKKELTDVINTSNNAP